ncbi:MAG TPA: substrate-binding domain-containing protein [Pseudolabrys sp.]|jgi:ABC-type molybdate transport system substrate-binding protein|nr:substrate-binding domain-containing protein [Pseudolabrys sp.]
MRLFAWLLVALTMSTAAVAQTPSIPAGKDTDIKFYPAKGSGAAVTGKDAFAQMPKAGLVLWLAGNQFFAMDDVVAAFQNGHPSTSIGLITLPPGLLLQAIKAGGWLYGGNAYRGRPDIYASVNLGHLKQLKAAGIMDSYRVYMHNELQIMVAQGNPKNIKGIDDLARSDVRTSMPNPINEGIMQFYIRKVLERHGLWQTISGGNECVHCQSTPNNWFTAVHHRETPERILANQSDAGVVWKTEVLAAKRNGAKIDAVELPDQDSLRKEVSYVIGSLNGTPHREAADAFLDFLGTADGQQVYARYGFVNASADELKPKPIE